MKTITATTAQLLGLGDEPAKPAQTRKSVRAMRLPDVTAKIMNRSYQRSGVVAGGTLLSSGARQATVTFPPATFRKGHLAAANAGVSFSEIVRQAMAAYLSE